VGPDAAGAVNSPICQIFMDTSMKVSGIVNTHKSRSLPARFTMNRFLGDKILGFSMTCARQLWCGHAF
jgi:hypothetical protein